MPFQEQDFGSVDGQVVKLYSLSNACGACVRICSFGCIIQELRVPDRDGRCDDVVLGFDRLDSYTQRHPYFGAVIGRYCNRIAGAACEIAGTRYVLDANNNGNHLHGGVRGFDKAVWSTDGPKEDDSAVCIEFFLCSEDGDQGYPGQLDVTVRYELSLAENTLAVVYGATCSRKPTVVNLTQHSYFNLCGHDRGMSCEAHVLHLFAKWFTPTTPMLIPTGEITSVAGTPLDFFSAPKAIGRDIGKEDYEPLRFGAGYDHNFVVNRGVLDGTLAPVARLHDPLSGRVLDVSSTEPGVQIYTANRLDGSLVGKGGAVRYGRRAGICLETQHFPDSPNKGHFPSTLLQPGEHFSSRTVYRFSTLPSN